MSYIDLDGLEEANPDQDIPGKIKFGNITFRNVNANARNTTVQEIINNEGKLANAKNTKVLKKKISKLRKEEIQQRAKAEQINDAIKSVISADNQGLVVLKNDFSLPFGDTIRPLKEISAWVQENNLQELNISLSIEKITTRTGRTALGATKAVQDSTGKMIGFRIQLSSTSINKDWALANEIGDVYFKSIMGESKEAKDDELNIVSYMDKYHVNKQTAHDKLYNTLNSTKYSSMVEKFYKKVMKQQKK